MNINPRIDRNTPVIVQGISGRAGTLHSQLMKEYGTRIVGGVSPKTGTNDIDGIPVFPSCADAVRATGATASVTLVGALQLLGAMEDAVAAGIKLIVTPTEGMPVHDALQGAPSDARSRRASGSALRRRAWRCRARPSSGFCPTSRSGPGRSA